ncbi:MAG TPA: CRISPR-associated endonuclease Cas1 [Methanospirillum sp.]|nr:CRISPR-associated endonuclease Cas1 [Methanospirillum sp.]
MTDRADLVINGYGASIRKKGNRFLIEHDGQSYEYATTVIRQILVTGTASISSAALQLAAEEGVDLVIISRGGDPSCRILPCQGSGIATVRRRQIAAAETQVGYHLMAMILKAKIAHQGRLLSILGRRRNIPELVTEGERIEALRDHIPTTGLLSEKAEHLRGIEGESSHAYFSALATILNPALYHGHRTQHPALDPFNAALNYGYGILYNEVEKACLLSGLDPYAGFLHGDRYGNKALVYDLIEPYRQPVIDRVIITLAVRDLLEDTDLDEKGWLTADAKRRVVTATIARLDDERVIGDKTLSFRNYLKEDIHQIARYLAEGRSYTPLDWRWR